LLEIVDALRACGRFAYFLHGGDEQRDQDRDDCDHDQQLDQGKPAAAEERQWTLHTNS